MSRRDIQKGASQPGQDMRGYRRKMKGDGWLVLAAVALLLLTIRLIIHF